MRTWEIHKQTDLKTQNTYLSLSLSCCITADEKTLRLSSFAMVKKSMILQAKLTSCPGNIVDEINTPNGAGMKPYFSFKKGGWFQFHMSVNECDCDENDTLLYMYRQTYRVLAYHFPV